MCSRLQAYHNYTGLPAIYNDIHSVWVCVSVWLRSADRIACACVSDYARRAEAGRGAECVHICVCVAAVAGLKAQSLTGYLVVPVCAQPVCVSCPGLLELLEGVEGRPVEPHNLH